jgi:sialate O-acetylesterase
MRPMFGPGPGWSLARLPGIFPFVLLACGTISTLASQEVVQLLGPWGDGAVVQRDLPIHVWGTGAPGTIVTVSFASSSVVALCDDSGRWHTSLPPQKAGGPHTLTLSAPSVVRTVTDLWVGEVWICSGQSNMRMMMKVSGDFAAARACPADPLLRWTTVSYCSSPIMQSPGPAHWYASSPTTVGGCSTLAWHVAAGLRQVLDVPIGMILCAWSGKPAEDFLPPEALAVDPMLVGHQARMMSMTGDAGYRALKQDPETTWPTSIWNGMIGSLAPVTARGFLWYQAEGNADRAAEYRHLFPALITGWRQAWGNPNMPFIFVQLPEFGPVAESAGSDSSWAQMRLAQETALELPVTGMVVGLGTGDPANAHPRSKAELGRRLLLAIQAVAYGRSIAWSGPILTHGKIVHGACVLRFSGIGDGLRTNDSQPPGHLAIQDDSGTWRWAEGHIDGPDQLVVRHPDVARPIAVRYAYASTPTGANMVNSDELPMRPWMWAAPVR